MSRSFAPPSWHRLIGEATAHRLPEDLRRRDARQAIDCGWVEQMQLVVRQFSSRGQRVLDPFAGFGSTLVACALEERGSIGIELQPARVDIIRDRLARYREAPCEVIAGDARDVSIADASVDLIATNLPYFEATAPSGREAAYEDHLAMLDAVFSRQRRALKDGGYVVAAAQNLRINRRFVPFAWDVGRLLARHFVLCDEQILTYDRQRPASPDASATNRAHEYLLVARRDDPAVDVAAALAVLRDLAQAGRFAVTGGLALRLVAPEALDRPPSDVDVLVPEVREAIEPLVCRLQERGFAVTSWGEPVTGPLTPRLIAGRVYLRAIRSGLTIDLTFAPPDIFEAMWKRATDIKGVPVLTRQDLRRQLERSGRPRDVARARALEGESRSERPGSQ